jgi:hypothetical protein
LLMDPFTGVNDEDEPEPLRPARTIISVGPSACNRIYVNIADRLSNKRSVQRWKKRTLIWPSDAANKAPVFVAEKPSKKMVVTL